MTKEEAYEKLDHTLCLNNNNNNIKFAISDIDCQSVDEMVECLELIKPKQYLKWKDILKLEIKTSMKDIDYTYINVKLNGMPIHLFIDKNRTTGRIYVSGMGKDKLGTTLFNACSDLPKSIEFFNALHLEVEE